MAEVVGLTLAKINGVYNVYVRNSRWSNRRTVNQIVTGGGVVESIGVELISGNFDEVIPPSPSFNWRALRNFTIQIYDQPTQKVLLMSAEGCNWEGIDGQNDLGSATSGRTIAWKGTKTNAA